MLVFDAKLLHKKKHEQWVCGEEYFTAVAMMEFLADVLIGVENSSFTRTRHFATGLQPDIALQSPPLLRLSRSGCALVATPMEDSILRGLGTFFGFGTTAD